MGLVLSCWHSPQPARPCGEAAGAMQHPCAGPSMRKFPLHQIIPISSCPAGPGPGWEPLRFSTKPLTAKNPRSPRKGASPGVGSAACGQLKCGGGCSPQGFRAR